MCNDQQWKYMHKHVLENEILIYNISFPHVISLLDLVRSFLRNINFRRSALARYNIKD
jgi:hypothetical protein